MYAKDPGASNMDISIGHILTYILKTFTKHLHEKQKYCHALKGNIDLRIRTLLFQRGYFGFQKQIGITS